MNGLLTDEQAQFMKHLVLQAIQDAHDSPIKPEAYFAIVRTAVKLLSSLECTVCMTTMLAMIECGMTLQAIHEGIAAAATVSTGDSQNLFAMLQKHMTAVQETRMQRTVN